MKGDNCLYRLCFFFFIFESCLLGKVKSIPMSRFGGASFLSDYLNSLLVLFTCVYSWVRRSKVTVTQHNLHDQHSNLVQTAWTANDPPSSVTIH